MTDEIRRHKVYVIGSLRNDEVPHIASDLRTDLKCDVFDDWYAAGPEADDYWRDYEKRRGRSYIQALRGGRSAEHVFGYDKHHLDTSDAVVLVLPAGKSGHLEAGYCIGRGKPVAILLDDPERWDVMYKFAGLVTDDYSELVSWLENVALSGAAIAASDGGKL